MNVYIRTSYLIKRVLFFRFKKRKKKVKKKSRWKIGKNIRICCHCSVNSAAIEIVYLNKTTFPVRRSFVLVI